MKKSRASKFFEKKVDENIEKFVENSLDIAVQVLDDLKELGWTQKEFAQKLNKQESEISKWLSGQHNLTLKTISKMEIVLGRKIIMTRQDAEQTKRPVSVHFVNMPMTIMSSKNKNTSTYTTESPIQESLLLA